MPEPDFYRNGNFQLESIWDKCVNMYGDYFEKLWWNELKTAEINLLMTLRLIFMARGTLYINLLKPSGFFTYRQV